MSAKASSHEERTASQPRGAGIELCKLRQIEQVNDTIRLMRLYSTDPGRSMSFLPGQWLDVFLPGLSRAGGFTITSTPREATPSRAGSAYLELAIQKSRNPPAQWLWRPAEEILDQVVRVRVGGSFTWPPPNMDPKAVQRLVLVAGGVGINPLISIFAHLMQQRREARPRTIVFLYGIRAPSAPINPGRILFLERLIQLIDRSQDAELQLRLFLTGSDAEATSPTVLPAGLPPDTTCRRLTGDDLDQSLGKVSERGGTLCYVCGPQLMTDEVVEYLSNRPGMTEDRVLAEKWW